MKVIIAGSRTITWNDFIHMWSYIPPDVVKKVTEVVSGAAKGPDKHGEIVARHNKIKLTQFPAQWGIHGKKAGIIRNMEMGDYADAAFLFWDGESRGTKHMEEYMLKLNKPVIIITRSDYEPSVTNYGGWSTLPAGQQEHPAT